MTTNQLTPVKSTQIKAIGYDASKKALTVEFNSGGKYRYSNVSPKQHAGIMKAEYVGMALAPIKSDPKKYPFKKL